MSKKTNKELPYKIALCILEELPKERCNMNEIDNLLNEVRLIIGEVPIDKSKL